MLTNKRRYDVVTTVRGGFKNVGEYMAIVPAFNNGYVYARTYANSFCELLGNINDLIKQEELFLLNRSRELPQNVELLGAKRSEIDKYLPYDELEESDIEGYYQVRVITLYVE